MGLHAYTATEVLFLIFAYDAAFVDLLIYVTNVNIVDDAVISCNRVVFQKSATESICHCQLIVYHGCHLVMEVGEKQRWPKAIFITSFLSVRKGLLVLLSTSTNEYAHIV